MALRLILVSAVASLGLSAPTGRQLSAWKQAAQGWVATRLAQWDAQMPADASAFTVLADSAPPASEPPAPAPEPPSPPARPERNEARAWVFVDEGLVLEALAALRDEVPHDHTGSVPGAPTLVVETKPTPRFEPFEPAANLYEGVAYALNHEAEGLDLPRTLPPPIARVAPKPEPLAEFEPMEVGDDLYPGIAFALNHEAEGLAATPPAPASGEIASTGRLSQAVRLTKEAVFAWASLLQGPAVVTMGH